MISSIGTARRTRTEEERENYYPVSIFCPHCGKDSTKIVSLSDDCTKAHYVCECGHEGDYDFTKDFNCKLQWKVDWPMRWLAEGVDFEPGGKGSRFQKRQLRYGEGYFARGVRVSSRRCSRDTNLSASRGASAR